jgi:endonuclease-3
MASRSVLKNRARKIVAALAAAYPEVECELAFRNAFEILVATILSAQCTDKKVNQATPALFRKFPTPSKMAQATPAQIEPLVHSLGLFKNKAKNLIAAARMLTDEFNGEIPANMEELVRLPGVGRKTANCVLVNAFHQPGIMCDTHCCRVSKRLGLHDLDDPVKIEAALAELLPRETWGDFSHRIILHGRRVCHSRKPECEICPLEKLCEYYH